MSIHSFSKSLLAIALIIMATFSAMSHTALANSLVVFSETPASYPWVSQKATDIMASRFSKAGYMVTDKTSVLTKIGQPLNANRQAILEASSAIRATIGNGFIIFVDYEEWIEPNSRQLSMRLAAQIYTTSNGFVANWVEPSQVILMPENCNQICLDGLLLPELEAQADSLASNIIQVLKRPTGSTAGSSDGEAIPIQIFKVEMIDLDNEEMLELMDLMEHEFPGFIAITQTESRAPRLRFSYHTTVSAQKLNEWLRVSLMEIGIDPDDDAALQVQSDFISIKRYDSIESRGSAGNTLKFN
ncbi:MAG: hypothetical protein ISQ21_07525 [Alphaproteobacteria bacterium]|nr:hypothetical protein [Alphaproteobacteria bacterium]